MRSLLLLLLIGCGNHTPNTIPQDQVPQAPQTTTNTSTLYWLPGTSPPSPPTQIPTSQVFDTWSVDRLDFIQQTWILEGTVGPPPGWLIITHEGDGFWSVFHGKYVFGLTHFDTRIIEISHYAPHTTREWPALGHELAHAWVFELSKDSELASQAGH